MSLAALGGCASGYAPSSVEELSVVVGSTTDGVVDVAVSVTGMASRAGMAVGAWALPSSLAPAADWPALIARDAELLPQSRRLARMVSW